MSLTHDYRYDLRVSGADEETLERFAAAFEGTRFIDYMGRDPDDPALFTTEAVYGGGGLYEETVETELHKLAMQFPSLKLYFVAEDLDDRGHGYDLQFQGQMYQRANKLSSMSEFNPPVHFDHRQDALRLEFERGEKADQMIQRLCKETDYDLLYAQKQALLNALETGGRVPNEVLEGLVNFLDQVGDLGETLGLFQYDGIEPPYPLQADYVKKEYSFDDKEPRSGFEQTLADATQRAANAAEAGQGSPQKTDRSS